MSSGIRFYFGDNWGAVIFAGSAFVAQLGYIMYLHRRYSELSSKYQLLFTYTDDIRNDINSLRSVVIDVRDKLNAVRSASDRSSQYQKSSADNPTSKPYSYQPSISHISSSSSVYADAIDEPFTPTDALNITTASVASASELLAPNSRNEDNLIVVATTSKKSQFENIDQLLEQNESKRALDECKKLYDSSEANKKNVELLWRYAKSCYRVYTTITNDNTQKKKLLQEGQKFAIEATKINENHYDAVKFAAITTGSLTDFLGTKDKIQQGYEFKKFLDKALSMQPTDHTLLHMRGRFSFSIASLSWLERKAAAAFYAEPPTATVDEAIADFLGVEKLMPDSWIINLYYLAKCYLAKGEKKLAVERFHKLILLDPSDESEKEMIVEAKTLIAKNSK